MKLLQLNVEKCSSVRKSCVPVLLLATHLSWISTVQYTDKQMQRHIQLILAREREREQQVKITSHGESNSTMEKGSKNQCNCLGYWWCWCRGGAGGWWWWRVVGAFTTSQMVEPGITTGDLWGVGLPPLSLSLHLLQKEREEGGEEERNNKN